MEISSIIAENERRKKKYFGHYDPISGEGSLLKRTELSFNTPSGVIKIYVTELAKTKPLVQCLSDTKDLDTTVRLSGLIPNDKNRQYILDQLTNDRLDTDFEFWAAMACKIEDKESKKMIPFTLNYPQRVLLSKIIEMWTDGLPIRIILLKARQWGGSTMVQLFMAWFQIRHYTNWHSFVMADIENQSRNIRGMYARMAKAYPQELGTVTLVPYEGSVTTRMISERGCIIGIGSAQKPDASRSFSLSMVHLSEVGLWKKTEGKSAEDLAQAVSASVPRKKNTLVVKESTAKGTGNYFHNEWIAAEEGKTDYAPVFIPWFFISIYREPVEDVSKFVSSWTDYDEWQWKQGATLEGIQWYRNFKTGERYDDWRMQSEFPTTAIEAFQSTGQRVFSPIYTLNAMKTCRDPLYIGDVHGRSVKGKESLEDIEFIPNSASGLLYVWAKPDTKQKIANRYCAFADIGGRTHKADYSVVKVFDRFWMIEGGYPTVVATWRGHLDQDLFAWKAAQIAKWYNNALLAVETNSLRNKGDQEGDHSYTILYTIADHYTNLFSRISPDGVKEGVPVKYGFHTNHSTKEQIIDCLNGALRDNTYVERDIRAYYEMETYERKPDGTMGAVDGRKDDLVICTAGGLWLASEYKGLEPPKEIIETYGKSRGSIISEASF